MLLITDKKKNLNNKGRLILPHKKNSDALYCCPPPFPKMLLLPPKQIFLFQAINNALKITVDNNQLHCLEFPVCLGMSVVNILQGLNVTYNK